MSQTTGAALLETMPTIREQISGMTLAQHDLSCSRANVMGKIISPRQTLQRFLTSYLRLLNGEKEEMQLANSLHLFITALVDA
jgi:hypothetical protein